MPNATTTQPSTTGASAVAVSAVAASKVYGSGDTKVTALDAVSIEFRAGELTASATA